MDSKDSEEDGDAIASFPAQQNLPPSSTGNSPHISNSAFSSVEPRVDNIPIYDSDSISTSKSSPSISNVSSGMEIFDNDILKWNTYQEFSDFCSNIGIILNNKEVAKAFLDYVRVQQHLPNINLDCNNACLEHIGALFL